MGGGVTSAALLWVLSGLVDWIPRAAAPAVVGGVALGVVARDLGLVTFGLPQRKWQVPKTILEQAQTPAALGFGFELGLGFRTYITASAPYLLLICLLLMAEPLWIYLLVGAAFGLGRFLVAVARYLSPPSAAWDGFGAAHGPSIKACSAVVAALGTILIVL